MESTLYVYGLMSGTSLDGVDVAVCSFHRNADRWKFKIHHCLTVPYGPEWTSQLSEAHLLDGSKLIALDREYGDYLGMLVNDIIQQTGFQPFLIASHGHTVFHSPKEHYTLQIGSGAQLAAKTRRPVVCDFRSTDVALGGQGAPLVPIGDILLFSEYDACLNLGGFANISFDQKGIRKAFDICPVNIVLNRFARAKDQLFDRDGKLGLSGSTNKELLVSLNSIPFYRQPFPKSLSREWIESNLDRVIEGFSCLFEDKIRTYYDHIAWQINSVLNSNKIRNVLITGGGTHNSFLIELLKQDSKSEIIIPDSETVDFKEALIFAFMGLLRYEGEINCLASVTGASRDSVCGAVYL